MAATRDDPWGEREPPAVTEPPPLPARLTELAALTEPLELPAGERFVHPRPEELPEVAALLAAGWRLADASPMWSFLPAVWPPALRCWVPDRLPRFSRSAGRAEDSTVITPWTPEVAEDLRRHDVGVLARVGLPSPPVGRIWLLRSPWPSIGVQSVVSLIAARAAEAGGGGMLDAALIDAAAEVLGWDEERVWDWWPGERGEVARAWRARGRVGEDAGAVVAARLTPELLADYEGHGVDEEAALAWTSTLYSYGREGLERARAWSKLGLSPEDVGRELSDAAPAEVAAWLAEGFDLDEVRHLHGLPLDAALAWRAAGFGARQVRSLLTADNLLTPEEAARFAELGVEDPRRWVECGFDAATARAWAHLDVLPNEARVWRAAGLDPESAAAHLRQLEPGAPRIPPGRWAWGAGWTGRPLPRPGEPIDLDDPEIRGTLSYSVADPPGTRGRLAWRARLFDDDPTEEGRA